MTLAKSRESSSRVEQIILVFFYSGAISALKGMSRRKNSQRKSSDEQLGLIGVFYETFPIKL
jgi:hypothetical protein